MLPQADSAAQGLLGLALRVLRTAVSGYFRGPLHNIFFRLGRHRAALVRALVRVPLPISS
jgi:hypothetical protein